MVMIIVVRKQWEIELKQKKSHTVQLDTISSHIQSSSNEIDFTNSELIPERCNENIARSKEGPLWTWIEESGGYTLHPVHAPASTNTEVIYKIREGVTVRMRYYLI